nr:hypothetical protein [Pelagibius litoralis]
MVSGALGDLFQIARLPSGLLRIALPQDRRHRVNHPVFRRIEAEKTRGPANGFRRIGTEDFVADAERLDCGFVFDTVEEAAKIVSLPFPQELRERGFELAERSGVKRHIHQLEDLWKQAA